MYTIATIAAALGVREDLVRQWLARGRLPAPSGRVGQSPWWAPGVIEPWMAQWLQRKGES